MYLSVLFSAAVLGRARRGNDRCIDHRLVLQEQALVHQRGIDAGQDLQAEVVAFQHMTEPKNRALLGQLVRAGIRALEHTEQHYSHSASSIAGSERLNQGCKKWMRSIAWSVNGKRPSVVPELGAYGAISETNAGNCTSSFISSRNPRLRFHLVLHWNPLSPRIICFMSSMSHGRSRAPEFCGPPFCVGSLRELPPVYLVLQFLLIFRLIQSIELT